MGEAPGGNAGGFLMILPRNQNVTTGIVGQRSPFDSAAQFKNQDAVIRVGKMHQNFPDNS